MPAKLTHQHFIRRVAAQFPSIEVCSEYAGQHAHIHLRCRTCRHEWRPYASNFMSSNSNCKRCSDRRKERTHDEIRGQIEAHGLVKVLGSYQGIRAPLAVECLTCSHRWGGTPHDLRYGHGCPRCAGKLLDHAEVVRRVEVIHGGALEVIGTYTTSQAPLAVRCRKCGREWKSTGNTLLRGCGCARCKRQGFDPTKPTILYCFRVHHDSGRTLYKIGITNRTPDQRYTKWERQRMSLIYRQEFQTGAAARAREQEIITANLHHRFQGKTGFSFSTAELFVVDVLGVDTAAAA